MNKQPIRKGVATAIIAGMTLVGAQSYAHAADAATLNTNSPEVHNVIAQKTLISKVDVDKLLKQIPVLQNMLSGHFNLGPIGIGNPDAGHVGSGNPGNPGKPSQGWPNSGNCNPGTPSQGTPDQGSSNPGTPSQGTPDQGSSDPGTPSQGTPDQGSSDPGTPSQGTPDQGSSNPGTPSQGTPDTGDSQPDKPSQGTPDTGSSNPGTPSQGTPDTGSGTTDPNSNDSFASQVVTLVNQQRATQGLKPLTSDSLLTTVALAKAKDMYSGNYFDHNSPTYGSPFDMMKSFGVKYSYAGENIAKGQQTPQEVMTAWMNSSGHRANIMNSNYGKIGVAYYNSEWVQEFTD